jgi:hypothetical protein
VPCTAVLLSDPLFEARRAKRTSLRIFASVPTNLHNYTDRLTNFFEIFCGTNQG